jgi:hypothetical protein
MRSVISVFSLYLGFSVQEHARAFIVLYVLQPRHLAALLALVPNVLD